MEDARLRICGAMMNAVLTVATMIGGAVAQSESETITVQVLPYECSPEGITFVEILVGTLGDTVVTVVFQGTSTALLPVRISVRNANRESWTPEAEINDFTLTTGSSEPIPGSAFSLVETDAQFSLESNPLRWGESQQPARVQALPTELDTGSATMSSSVTFTGSPTAVGSGSVMLSSAAAYGSLGTWSVNYMMHVDNQPTDQAAGIYTPQL